ncbi:Outer membrane protein IcsA autotransporter (fragment) [Burkholderiales bacterium 8X]
MGANITGGNGGAGGGGSFGSVDAPNRGGYPGLGGDGGAGIVQGGTGTATVLGGVELRGGTGGSGGTGGVLNQAFQPAGRGGAGAVLGPGTTLDNSGSIVGGNGGPGGVLVSASGGQGIVATGASILNSGSIVPGLSLVGTPDAIFFAGGNSSLELRPGSSIQGSITIARLATADIRPTAAGLDLGTVLVNNGIAFVDTQASGMTIMGPIVGTGVLAKLGANELTIADTNTYTGGTVVGGGTLSGTGTSFGTGTIDNNATLRVRADTAPGRLDNLVSGTGTLVKFGGGELTLGSINSYSGGTVIEQGVLTGGMNSFGSGAIVNNAELMFTISGISIFLPTLPNAISGSGLFRKLGPSAMALSGDNTYTGGTFVDEGTLVGNSRSFGSGPIALQGNLVLNQVTDGAMNNSISGGPLNFILKQGAGALTLNGPSSFSMPFSLKQGRVNVGSNTALGTSVLNMDDGTTLGFAAGGLTLANNIFFTGTNDPFIDSGPFTSTLTGVISGAADMSKIGSGVLVLAGANTYTGATTVAEGTLRAGAAGSLSTGSAHTVAAGATLDIAGFAQSLPSLTNAGVVSLPGTAPGARLTVTGAYVGNNGVLRLGTALGDSSSASDRLVLDGPAASASGTTSLQIVNLGGLGALTTGNGIEVISALNGATTTAQTTRSAFGLAGTVAAGPYVYRLAAADASGAGENWYLRSTEGVPVVVPGPPITTPPGGTPGAGNGGAGGGDGGGGAGGGGGGGNGGGLDGGLGGGIGGGLGGVGARIVFVERPSYRPEASLAVALPSQLRQANLSILANRQRLGDDSTDAGSATLAAASADTIGARRAWGRVLTTDPTIQQGGTLSTRSKGRLSGFQAGTDVWAAGAWKAGVYVGQLDGDLQVDGFVRGQEGAPAGTNDLRNRYVGGYVDWSGPEGWYAEAVLQAGRHRFRLKPVGSASVEGKGKSLLASLEVGKAFEVAPGWKLEPQLQLIHQRSRFDDFNLTGAQVGVAGEGGITIRAGLRIKGEIATGAGVLQPYARLNVYRQPSGKDSARFSPQAVGATTLDAPAGGTSTEVAGGFTLALSPSTSVYGEVGKLAASGGDARVKSSLQGSLGIKVRW